MHDSKSLFAPKWALFANNVRNLFLETHICLTYYNDIIESVILHDRNYYIAERLKRETIYILVAAFTGCLEFVIMEDILSCLVRFTYSKLRVYVH